MNSKKKGDAGVGQAIAYFTAQGYTVSIPLTDSQDYDLIVDDGGDLNKVQVKTGTHELRPGYFTANLSVKGGNQSFNTIKKFDKTKVDFLYIVMPHGNFLIPTNVVDSSSTLGIGNEDTKYSKFRV